MRDEVAVHDDGWRHTADRATLYADPTTTARKAKLRAALAALPAGAPVLDFGCGRAEFTVFLCALDFAAVGIDASPSAVNYNRHDFPEVPFHVVAPGERAPFADASFSAVWCSEVVEHVY